MLSNKFNCPVRIEEGADGYPMPIYPQNPDPELRDYIIRMARSFEGQRATDMNSSQIWYVNAASRIITTERLRQEEATSAEALRLERKVA